MAKKFVVNIKLLGFQFMQAIIEPKNDVCFEYAYWTRFSLPNQFDGIFFMDKTRGAKK